VVPVIFTYSVYDVIDVNECFHDFMFVNRAHPRPLLRFGKFSSTARCKDLKSLYCTIRFTILVLPIARSEQNRTEQEVRKLKQEVSKI
jgi:hypothetical protein